jgi:acetyl-CoA C-acetyltransferase
MEAYIIDAVRTAGGRRGGKLAGWHPADMAAEVLNALVGRSGIDPAAVEDVIMGCVRCRKRWGLQTMCEGGGIANVTIVEAL